MAPKNNNKPKRRIGWDIDFDPNVTPTWASRPLSELELCAIWVYLEEAYNPSNDRNPNQVSSQVLKDMLPKVFEQLPVLQSELENLRFHERKALLRSKRDELFVGYLSYEKVDMEGNTVFGDVYLDLGKQLVPFIRRACGIGIRGISKYDADKIVDFVESELHQRDQDFDPSKMTLKQYRKIESETKIIPALGIPVQGLLVVTRNLSNGSTSLNEMLAERHGVDTSLAMKKSTGLSYEDILSDYQGLMEKLRMEKDVPNYVPLKIDIDANFAENPNSAISYAGYWEALHRLGKNLKDVRIDSGILEPKGHANRARSNYVTWQDYAGEDKALIREKILDVYILMWSRVRDCEIDLNDDERVKDFMFSEDFLTVEEILEFNKHLGENYSDHEMKNFPAVNNETVTRYFGGYNQLFAAIEYRYQCELNLDKNSEQLQALICKANPVHPNSADLPHVQAPKMVRDALRSQVAR